MSTQRAFDPEDLVIAVFCALDDALREAHIECHHGKLLPRRGPAPKMDDREVLCLAVIQELLGFESDNLFFLWIANHPIVRKLFPRLLSRQKFADRRALLTPLLQRLCQAFCALGGEASPPFRSWTPIRSMSASSSESVADSGSVASPLPATALPSRPTSTACASI